MTSMPVAQRGYAHPELLTDTDWLAAHLDDPRVRIIDARASQQYAESHIPGAVSMDGFGAGIPRAANHDMAEPDAFNVIAGALGIDNNTTVVVYDVPSQRMGMVAWTFLYYGHKDVRILDGGFDKWTSEARPTSTDAATYQAATYTAHTVPAVYCSLEDAKAGQADDSIVFWDTRAPGEYDGTVAGFGAPLPRMGRVPGAVHLEWTELLDPQTKTFKSASDLQSMLAERSITPDKHVASYCQGGARGALAAYVLRVLGFEQGTAYAGSFQQWSNNADVPVEKD